jgi:predicted CXXCH cytochrome family protein
MTRIEHGIAVGRAHFTNEGVRLSARGIDDVTRECVSCHDGSVAAPRGAEVRIGLRGSHPVGRVYDEASRAGRNGRLRPKATLPAEVQLAQGTVGCQSCHSPFSQEPDMVTLPMLDSLLCRSCHDM